MVKEVFFFTEMGYSAYSQEVAARYGYTNLMFPNENYDPQKASELYSMYFDELQYCTETGFDGVMINEHHNNPLSMMPSVNVIGSVLAKHTRAGLFGASVRRVWLPTPILYSTGSGLKKPMT
jgi:hypothetical protein